MKKSVFLLTTLLPLGCVLNEDEKTPAPRKIAAGLYTGDYKWIDTSEANKIESELFLDPNSTYRHTVTYDNDPIVGTRGEWEPRSASLFFSKIEQGRAYGGHFAAWVPLKGDEALDTMPTRDVTDSTFVRKEYTGFRQKPYWITYTRRVSPRIPEGHFLYTDIYRVDSVRTVENRMALRLEAGKAMFLSGFEDSLENYQAAATWSQAGSFLVYKDYRYRYYEDSLKAFTPNWDTIPGEIFSRVGAISDTAIQIWSPAQFIFPGHWDVYKRIP
jgi:hypothetical protein